MFQLNDTDAPIAGMSALSSAGMLGLAAGASNRLEKLRGLEADSLTAIRRGMSEEAFSTALKESSPMAASSLGQMMTNAKTHGNLLESKVAQLAFDKFDDAIALNVGMKYGMPVGAVIAAAPLALIASRRINQKINELKNR